MRELRFPEIIDEDLTGPRRCSASGGVANLLEPNPIKSLARVRRRMAVAARILERPRIAERLPKGVAELLLKTLEHEAIWVDELPVVEASPDPDDNPILATAIAGGARPDRHRKASRRTLESRRHQMRKKRGRR